MSKGRATSRRARREPEPEIRYWFALAKYPDGRVNADFYDGGDILETKDFPDEDAMYVGFGEFVQRRNTEAPSDAIH